MSQIRLGNDKESLTFSKHHDNEIISVTANSFGKTLKFDFEKEDLRVAFRFLMEEDMEKIRLTEEQADKLREIAEHFGTTVDKLLSSGRSPKEIIESYEGKNFRMLNEDSIDY
jgi:Zn-dependent peptidase ImmA (M78 family)